MTLGKIIAFSVFFFPCFFLEAVSLRLHNETHNSLTALVFSADGSLLGEVLVRPKEIASWNNEALKEGLPAQGPSKSITPMNVEWIYQDGEVFCVSERVTSGSLVQTSQGVGKKYMRMPTQCYFE